MAARSARDRDPQEAPAPVLRKFLALFEGANTLREIGKRLEKGISELENENQVVHFTDTFCKKVASAYRSSIEVAAEVAASPIRLWGVKSLCARFGTLGKF